MKLNLEDKYKAGIYCIVNDVNNKMYIGKSQNIYFRLKQHITMLNKKSRDENIHLIRAWHKYGRHFFRYSVLEYCDKRLLQEKELFYIQKYNTIDRNFGYNIRLDSSSGMIVSDETRERLRNAQNNRFKRNGNKCIECSHTFWRDNPDKAKEMGIKISKNNNIYKFEKYSKTGELIETFENILEIVEKNPNYKKHNIYAACSGEKPSMYGYIWKKVLKG